MPRALVPLTVLVLAACGSSPSTPQCASNSDCATGQSCVDGTCKAPMPGMDGGGSDAGHTSMPDGGSTTVVSLGIDPADPVLTSTDGASVSQTFTLTATYSDGHMAAVSTGFWSLGSTRLGTIDSTTGVFTAEGESGGTETVSVDALGMTATTTVTVNLDRHYMGDGVPADAPTSFASTATADTTRQAGLLYPLADVVFPQNVYPPDVQWERGDAGDVYRLTFTAPHTTLTAYVVHSGGGFGYDLLIPRAEWRALADSSGGETVTLVVDRFISASSETIAGAPRSFQFASASITGAIYYWDLGAGRIQRIGGDGSGRETLVPNPPARPTDGERCIACHTISRDGRRMAAEVWDASQGYGAVLDLTADLSGDPPPFVVPPTGVQFLTSSFNPDATRLIANWANEIFLVDANTGMQLPTTGTPLPTTSSAQPEWSPDGNTIAFVMNHNGASWGVDFTASDLGVIPVTGADAFGAPSVIVPGGGRALARPSWSPDSQWIGIQDGMNSRSANGTTLYPAHIRLVRADGSVTVDLDALNGGEENSYYPTFSPFDEGGFFWLAFFSSRDYGNAQVGTRGTHRRQLWVSAISNDPSAGSDASHPPYWIPQQDVTQQNMAAFWAQEACRADGRTCAASSECCSGFCRDVGAGPVCVPPDVPSCSMTGEACRTDSDCCDSGDRCASNVCTMLN